MQVIYQYAILGCLSTIVAILVIAYRRLSSLLATTDQVLPVWEYIAETPILRNYVGRIFTMLVKIRSPYSRSIGSLSHELFSYLDFRILSLEVGRCCGQLNRMRLSDGPFHCTHGVALTLFAEILARLAVFSRLKPGGRGILLKAETEYIKKARGIPLITHVKAYVKGM